MELCGSRFDMREWLRGNEVSARSFEGAGRSENLMVPPPSSKLDDSTGQEGTSDERETRLELWMEEVKAFIRNIDVSKL
jgi:hypothetical protein